MTVMTIKAYAVEKVVKYSCTLLSQRPERHLTPYTNNSRSILSSSSRPHNTKTSFTTKMPTPGVLLAKSHLLSSTTITPETFAHWYHNIHIPDVLASEGAPPLALHYTNVDPSAKWANLIVYRLPEVSWVGSEAMK